MRLIMVAAPEGKGDEVAGTAFSVGIDTVSRRQITSVHSDGKTETKDVVGVETSTPLGKRYIDAILDAPFYDRDFNTLRHLRSFQLSGNCRAKRNYLARRIIFHKHNHTHNCDFNHLYGESGGNRFVKKNTERIIISRGLRK